MSYSLQLLATISVATTSAFATMLGAILLIMVYKIKISALVVSIFYMKLWCLGLHYSMYEHYNLYSIYYYYFLRGYHL